MIKFLEDEDFSVILKWYTIFFILIFIKVVFIRIGIEIQKKEPKAIWNEIKIDKEWQMENYD